MDNELVIQIFNAAANILTADGYDADVYEGYSGRGMYGRETVGITTDAPGVVVGWAIFCAAVEMTEDDTDVHRDDVFEILPKRQDSLGLSMIYY